MNWTFEDARDHLDDVLDLAESEGPQTIHCPEGNVVCISEKQLAALMEGHAKPNAVDPPGSEPGLEDIGLHQGVPIARHLDLRKTSLDAECTK